METLKIYLNFALLAAIVGFCISWVYEKLTNQHSGVNKGILRYVWAKVLYDDGTTLMFRGKFFAKQPKYFSTYLLKVEAELTILNQLQRLEKNSNIYDIMIISKTTFESELKLNQGKIQFVDYKGVLNNE